MARAEEGEIASKIRLRRRLDRRHAVAVEDLGWEVRSLRWSSQVNYGRLRIVGAVNGDLASACQTQHSEIGAMNIESGRGCWEGLFPSLRLAIRRWV